jgi:general secretion pathway protein K
LSRHRDSDRDRSGLKPRRNGAARPRDAGVALILALLFVVLLTVLVVEFMYEAQVEASFAENQGGELEAYLAAKSAVAKGIALLAQDQLDSMLNGEPEYDSEMDLTPWVMGQPFEPLNEGFMRTSVADEYGKINLNALLIPSQSGGEPEERAELVAALREFFALRDAGEGASPESIVDAILDWLDYNDTDNERTDGAENSYYTGLENPYTCKNGPMDSVEELLLIKGITAKVYFGDPEQKQLPLSEYLTVHGDWEGRVNANTAREETLAAVIAGYTGGAADLGLGQRIYEDARMQPFTDPSQLDSYGFAPQTSQAPRQNKVQKAAKPATPAVNPNPVPNPRMGGTNQGMFTVRSNVFRIYGDGMRDEVLVRVEAYVWRTPLDLSDWPGGGFNTNQNLAPSPSKPVNTAQQAQTLAGQQANQQLDGSYNAGPPKEPFRILDWKVIR